MSQPNPTSVPRPSPPAGDRWAMRLSDGRLLGMQRVGLDGRVRLTVAHEHATPSTELYLERDELRTIGAAARLLAGASLVDGEEIRKDERARLAQLFEENRDTLSTFPRSTTALLDLIVLLLRLNTPKEVLGDANT